MLTLISTAIFLFIATNIDNFFFLITWFSQVKTNEQKRQIIVGQYLGFMFIFFLSLIGAIGALSIPKVLLGLLGLIPIYIGIKSLKKLFEMKREVSNRFEWMIKSASISFVNGIDNISIYIPFFSMGNLWNIILVIVVFLLILAVWCYVGYLLVRQPLIAQKLEFYGGIIIPFILIGLGIYILIKYDVFHFIFSIF